MISHRTIRDAPLRRKLNFIILVTMMLALLVVCTGILVYDRSSFQALMAGNLATLAEVIGNSCRPALTFDSPEAAERTLASLSAEPDIIMACVYDADGKVFATYLRETGQEGGTEGSKRALPPAPEKESEELAEQHLQVARHISDAFEGTVIGTIVLRSSISKMQERRNRYLLIATLAFAIAIAIAMAISSVLIRSIVRPLRIAMHVTRQVSTGDLEVAIEVPSDDEVGQLLGAFKLMTSSLSSLIGKVKSTCIQITSATTRVVASSRQLEATASEQAASTNQVVSTAREISATSKELVNTMNEVARMAEETAVSAGSGHQGLIDMEAVMQQLEQATGSIAGKLAAIDQKAAEITGVVTTITKVADQTNLLSLNAAIEADKAGEAGLGFGVVAREIRRLADQTAVATLDIDKVVGEMKRAVADGVERMEEFSGEVQRGVKEIGIVASQFAQIISQIQALTPRFDAVKQGMETQSLGAGQISEAMVQLGSAAAHTAESVRETNRAMDELTASSQSLKDEISTFKVRE